MVNCFLSPSSLNILSHSRCTSMQQSLHLIMPSSADGLLSSALLLVAFSPPFSSQKRLQTGQNCFLSRFLLQSAQNLKSLDHFWPLLSPARVVPQFWHFMQDSHLNLWGIMQLSLC